MRAADHLALLRRAGLAPKKSFGQNFLISDGVLARIAATCVPDDEVGLADVVELGAGLGALTAVLAERARHVTAVERDRDLLPVLAGVFADDVASGKLGLLEADAQSLDLASLLPDRAPAKRVLAGNLPYQITGQLLRLAVEQAEHVDRVVFMVQAEVAERLAASPSTKAYGALSVFVQAAFDVRLALEVPPGAFAPPPKVTSAVVRLVPLRPRRAEETPTFRSLVKLAFGARRKTLRNAWRGLHGDLGRVEAAAETARVSLDARGETLSVDDYARMARALDALSSP